MSIVCVTLKNCSDKNSWNNPVSKQKTKHKNGDSNAKTPSSFSGIFCGISQEFLVISIQKLIQRKTFEAGQPTLPCWGIKSMYNIS